jgi:menaquinone-specific isochorismate synthase
MTDLELDTQHITSTLDDLSRKVLAASDIKSVAPGAPVRVAIDIATSDPLLWLKSLPSDKKIYWHDREHRFEFAGFGVAHTLDLSGPDSLSALDTMSDTLGDTGGSIRFFGGLRFDSLPRHDRSDPGWRSFGQGFLLLPRVALMLSDNQCTLACHLMPNETTPPALDRIARQIRELRLNPAVADNPPDVVNRTDCPEYDTWVRHVAAILKAISDGRCQKTVLARQTELELSTPVNPWRVLRNLRSHSEKKTLFGVQIDPGAAFIGATPERLYYRKGTMLESEALAGSSPRGTTPEMDATLTRELLNSAKDRREHDFVVNSLRAHLCTMCADLSVDPAPEVRKLAGVQHLYTRIAGRLRDRAVDGRLLSLMHPTPAVNGYPRTAALNLIRELEPFDRGWYAGAVGWISPNEAEFVVAIRSALIAGNRALVYAGAGIVDGSSPDQEWAEIENKIAPMIAALSEAK